MGRDGMMCNFLFKVNIKCYICSKPWSTKVYGCPWFKLVLKKFCVVDAAMLVFSFGKIYLVHNARLSPGAAASALHRIEMDTTEITF